MCSHLILRPLLVTLKHNITRIEKVNLYYLEWVFEECCLVCL